MRFYRRPFSVLLGLALALPLIATSGCTSTDILRTGNAPFTLQVELVNSATRFGIGLFTITRLDVRPNDPDADAALGPLDIALIAAADDVLNIDLNLPGLFDPTTLTMPSGSYRISFLRFGDISMLDFIAPFPPADCLSLRFYELRDGLDLDDDDLGGLLPDIEIDPLSGGSLTFTIDGLAFTDAFVAAWDCDLNTGQTTTFDQDLFLAGLANAITFN